MTSAEGGGWVVLHLLSSDVEIWNMPLMSEGKRTKILAVEIIKYSLCFCDKIPTLAKLLVKLTRKYVSWHQYL
jgi:hypothetical protein